MTSLAPLRSSEYEPTHSTGQTSLGGIESPAPNRLQCRAYPPAAPLLPITRPRRIGLVPGFFLTLLWGIPVPQQLRPAQVVLGASSPTGSPPSNALGGRRITLGQTWINAEK
jgi:hypothetical protein